MKLQNLVGIAICAAVLLVGGITIRRLTAFAVTDTCSFSGVDVPTEFNASFPTTVKQGESFTVSGITSKPSNSYSVTVYRSNLKMSATNSTPTSYDQNNTSTDPSPTTGQTSYTAYYPNWTLKATGSVGSSIVLNLVSAVATIDNGQGAEVDIPCNLSKTLATISIVAQPASAPSSGTSNTPPKDKTNSQPSEKPKENNTDEDTEEGQDESTDKPKDTTVKDSDTGVLPDGVMEQVRNVSITIYGSRGKPASGARVTIDDQLTVETGGDGTALFENIRVGEHRLKVVLGDSILEKTLQVSEDESQNSLKVEMPSKMNLWVMIGAGLGGIIFLGVSAFTIVKYQQKRRSQMVATTPGSHTQDYSGVPDRQSSPIVESHVASPPHSDLNQIQTNQPTYIHPTPANDIQTQVISPDHPPPDKTV